MKKCRFWILVLAMIMLIFMEAGCSSEETAEEQSSLIEKIESYQGYTRVVEQEEYDFYSYFVKRDLAGEISQEELDEKIRSYINEVNAVFYLGNELGLCEPYSFDLLKLRMEQENDIRKVKLEQKEAVYGLQEFQMETYFQYVFSNLESDIITYLEQNADAEMIRQAREYYNANQELFHVREGVTYEITEKGQTESVTVDRGKLNFLGKSDMGLADFLENGEIGDVFEDILDGEDRKVLLKDIKYGREEVELDQETIIFRYILSELYPALIKTTAKDNPVEFNIVTFNRGE